MSFRLMAALSMVCGDTGLTPTVWRLGGALACLAVPAGFRTHPLAWSLALQGLASLPRVEQDQIGLHIAVSRI